MTKMTLAIASLRDERRVADHEVNIQESDRATSTALANVITDAWMLASYCPIFHYVMAESIVRNNAEAIAMMTGALGAIDAGDKCEEKQSVSEEHTDAPSVGDLLASDRRSLACKTLGGEYVSSLTTPFRKDLILASSVVC